MTQLLNRNNTDSHHITRNQLSVEIKVNENTIAKSMNSVNTSGSFHYHSAQIYEIWNLMV